MTALVEPGPAAAPAGLWAPGYRALTWGLVLTVTLVAFEALAVVTILPVVVRDLGNLWLYGWVTSAFFLGTMSGIVVAGAATDRSGPARPFVAGLVLFAGGLTIGGLAPSMYVLVAGRLVQGLGAGVIPAVAYATIGRSFPESLRPRLFATMSTAWVVPGLGGPALSALVAEHVGWRWVFLGLLPLVLGAGATTLPALRRLGAPAPAPAGPDAVAPAGTAAAAVGAAGVGAAGVGAAGTAAAGAEVPSPSLLAALGVSAGAGLVLAGLTSRSPFGLIAVAAGLAVGIVPLRRILPAGTLRARRGVPAAVLARGLLTFAFFGADSFVPLAFTAVRHTSTTVAGIAVTAATVSWTSASWLQARMATRWTGRRLVTAGLIIVVTGVGLTACGLSSLVPVPVAIIAWGVAGFGIGLAYAPLAIVVLAAAGAAREGQASTSLQLSDNLGTALGSGVGGVAVAAGEAAYSTATAGIGLAFAIAATVGLVGIGVARRIPATTVPVAG